jgi:cytochrome c2
MPVSAHLPAERHRPGTRRRLAAIAVVTVALGTSGCGADAAEAREAAAITGGDPALGPDLMRRYGCQTCHVIPGVDGADGLVGPPLTGIASRSYVGGVLTNTPEHMIRWIVDPKAVDSLTAMPRTGVSASDARHIAAYLYTLR